MKKNKYIPFIIVLLIIVVIFISFITTRETNPSADTRIILEHTHKTYIAPTCFEDSDPTNFLQESTLEKAKDLNYEAHSSCTEDALEGINERYIISILKEIGVLKKGWDTW